MDKTLNLVIKNFTTEAGDGQITIKGFANRYLDDNGNLVVDRSDESVLPESYDLTNFMKNPVLLYQHRQDEIVGKVTNINLTSKGLEIEAVVYEALNPKVYFAVKEGILKAFSIGFKGIDYKEMNGVWYWTKIELYEVSIVSIPDNQESLFTVLENSPCENGVCLLSTRQNLITKGYVEMGIEKAIKNNVISDKAWGDVDKTALGQKLADLGKENYIKECYLVVGDVEKRSTWKFPHHELQGEDLVVNKNGVISAYQALRGARNNPNISAVEKRDASRHLLKHYREMLKQEMISEIPADLEEMAKEFEAQVEKIYSEIKELTAIETKASRGGTTNLGKDKVNQIIESSQGLKEGDQVQGGDNGELIVNVTSESVLTAYPNPPLGYRIRRYVKDDGNVYDFVIGRSEVAKLLAFMKDYFQDRDDNGVKKEQEPDNKKELDNDSNQAGKEENKEENVTEQKTEENQPDLLEQLKEKANDVEGLDYLLNVYGELEKIINEKLTEHLQKEEDE